MNKQFIQASRAYYARSHLIGNLVDEVTFGENVSGDSIGKTTELSVKWIRLINGGPFPKLEIYDDAWRAFYMFSGVFIDMAILDNKNVTPEKFCEMLKDHGFEDVTPTTMRKRG